MSSPKIDLAILVDTSNVMCRKPELLASVTQTIEEILSELKKFIHQVCLVTYSNAPNICTEWVRANNFDSQIIEVSDSGMSNMHLGLTEISYLLHKSNAEKQILLLFMFTVPTDTDSVLPDDSRDTIDNESAIKYLISGSDINIRSLKGYKVDSQNVYALGSSSDLDRLREDVASICSSEYLNEADSISENDIEQLPKNEVNSSISQDSKSHGFDINHQNADGELMSPEFYGYH